ncbi:4-hydroxyphenylacetate 3-monooxygenase, oxygenase component [Paenibacillus athensensis]|uniref:4-hydroxyphenylacetate 3-monooxygenase, oxygenase component n=1 Tax=Paenibacillus athensensis TaxID=1967502 RepID=A0A4Y8PRB0_9BACL|nr:4-hydroxyphenylacetate 3-hydroxylase N-terminal domain-containing protein [Paenibacillus athensensis]MCD1259293.1 4-hydroxyphenylacetate 3-monooxygenase, oxygenase component [Paenibacillus athensensis]
MPVKNGSQYVERINSSLPDVRIAGERLTGAISEHQAFKGVMATQAAMYDMQHDERWQASLCYSSPLSSEPVGLSFLQPKTKRDLAARRKMMQVWAEAHHGFLGRAPDYMNTAVMAFAAAARLLEEDNPQFAENLQHYYEYCRENDITLSHVFIQPKAARFPPSLARLIEEPAAARVTDKNKDGIVVCGAFLMDTQGVTSDEIFVYPAPFFSESSQDSPYAFAFAVPSRHPGVRFVCRESFVGGDSAYNYPLSSRYDEMDTLVIFDHALIPWNRVFICGNESMLSRLFDGSHFHTHAGMQIMCKNIAKTEFVLGTLEMLIETSGLQGYGQIVEKVTEVIVALETLKALQLAAEKGAALDRWGSMLPDRKPLLAANVYFPQIYPRLVEIVQLIGASSLIMIPDEKDFDTDLDDSLNLYLKGIGLNGKANVQLSRLAWDLSVSAFGGRQTVYERFFFGNVHTVSSRLYNGYEHGRELLMKRVQHFLS